MTYKEAEAYLLQIPKFTKKNPLDNTKKFIDCLKHMAPANPENVIHVAGTNGKGSVCAFLNEILTEAGYKTGMFTSPHLVSMTERFRINGKPVSEECFVRAFEQVRDCVERGCEKGLFVHPTFFEWLFGMACLIFAGEKTDYVIMETGMGGRLDATNVMDKPLACVITSVGMDHTEYLGETLETIAGEKAGIIKAGVPVIYDGNKQETAAVIRKKAAAMQAPTCEVSMKNCEILYFGKKNIDFLLNCEYYNNMRVSLGTVAVYQIMNAALAAVTIQTLKLSTPITADMVAKALGRTKWPGRMEWLRENFLIDGAHNEDGIHQLIQSLKEQYGQIVLLYSAVRDKEYTRMISLLCRSLDLAGVVVTRLPTPRGVEAEELYERFCEVYRGPVYLEEQVCDAVRKAEEICTKGIILGTGSLYLVGELRKLLAED